MKFMLFLWQRLIIMLRYFASVAKLVDALDLGSSGSPVGVRVSPLAPSFLLFTAIQHLSKCQTRWTIPNSNRLF